MLNTQQTIPFYILKFEQKNIYLLLIHIYEQI